MVDAEGNRRILSPPEPYRPYVYCLVKDADQVNAACLILAPFVGDAPSSPCGLSSFHGTNLEMYLCGKPVHVVKRKLMDRFRESEDMLLKIHFPSLRDLRSATGELVDNGFPVFERPTGPAHMERQLMDLVLSFAR